MRGRTMEVDGIRTWPRWAARAPNAILEEVDRAGHWPWVDRPELIDRAIRFLEAGGA